MKSAKYVWVKIEGQWQPGRVLDEAKNLYDVIGLEWEVAVEEIGPEIILPSELLR